ncbi:unnamed protein product [Tetraodon nigroviridis]|uniref:Chromosome undetermined SCAF10674, whole genome shotgun sequence n=1 Tax=Tetraodon nigroviridis TaxID=99883 RepID=Q4T1C4_TETNG|nr:unnamed protein product [Tetraodon nigroviridis]
MGAGPTLAGREEGGENNLLSFIHQQTGSHVQVSHLRQTSSCCNYITF